MSPWSLWGSTELTSDACNAALASKEFKAVSTRSVAPSVFNKPFIPDWAFWAAGKLIKLDTINEGIRRAAENPVVGVSFYERVLQEFQVELNVRNFNSENIPKTGGLVVVSNHPTGGLDGIALAAMVSRVRNDVKIVVVDAVKNFHGFDDKVIPVYEDGADAVKKNIQSKKDMEDWVASGGTLIIFPSGKIAAYDVATDKLTEEPWKNTAFKIAKSAKAPILTTHLNSKSSPRFYASQFNRRASQFVELSKIQGSTVDIDVAAVLRPEDYNGDSASPNEIMTQVQKLYESVAPR